MRFRRSIYPSDHFPQPWAKERFVFSGNQVVQQESCLGSVRPIAPKVKDTEGSDNKVIDEPGPTHLGGKCKEGAGLGRIHGKKRVRVYRFQVLDHDAWTAL